MEFSHICRVCLAEKLDLFDIFQECRNSSTKTTYSEIVQEISQIAFDADDEFSKFICSTCKESCEEFLRFREQIVSSLEYQRIILQGEQKVETEEPITIVIEATNEQEMQIIEDNEKNFVVEPFVELNVHEIVTISENEEDMFYDLDEITGEDLISSAASSDVSEDEDVTENEDKLYNCSKCMKSFTKESKYQKHLKSHSTKARIFPCKTCKRKFTTEILLARHEIVHSDLITQIKFETNHHRCIICNEVFKEKTNYEDHVREHKMMMKEQTLLACIYCDKPYGKLSNLIRHLKTHDENKTHECNVCQKTFAMGQDLIDHLNKHRGFNPHSCQICGKSYTQISKLNNHIKTHTEAKVSCHLIELQVEL